MHDEETKMIKKIIGSLLCVILFVSFAWADLNSPTISDEEYLRYINTSDELKIVDAKINAVFNELSSLLNDESKKDDLLKEERQWITTRDTKAFSEGEKGSQVYIESLVTTTTERISELEAKLRELKPNPETSGTAQTPIMPPPVQIKNQNIPKQSESSDNEIPKKTELYAVHYFWLIILLGVLAYYVYSKNRKNINVENYLLQITDFNETQKIMGVDDHVGISIDEQRKKVCLINYPAKQFRVISYQDLLSSEIFEDGESISKAMRGSQIAGAIIGNIAFGGVGAIIGGLSGKRKTAGTVNRIYFRLTVNDIKQPIFDINFLNKETKKDKPIYQQALQKARHCHGLVEVLIKRADMEDRQLAQKTNTSNDQQVSKQLSVADELKKLADLRDSGALTNEEFQQQKAKLIS